VTAETDPTYNEYEDASKIMKTKVEYNDDEDDE